MRVAVIGSRGIKDGMWVRDTLSQVDITCLVSGGAAGVDTIAEQYAEANGIPTIIYKPDYPTYGRRAPLIRNHQIIAEADLVMAFWDGESRGTCYTINAARRQGIPVRVMMK